MKLPDSLSNRALEFGESLAGPGEYGVTGRASDGTPNVELAKRCNLQSAAARQKVLYDSRIRGCIAWRVPHWAFHRMRAQLHRIRRARQDSRRTRGHDCSRNRGASC